MFKVDCWQILDIVFFENDSFRENNKYFLSIIMWKYVVHYISSSNIFMQLRRGILVHTVPLSVIVH